MQVMQYATALALMAGILASPAIASDAPSAIRCDAPLLPEGSGLAHDDGRVEQALTPGKFALVGRLCGTTVAAAAAERHAAPRAEQLSLYATGYRAGSLADDATPRAPATPAALMELPIAPYGYMPGATGTAGSAASTGSPSSSARHGAASTRRQAGAARILALAQTLNAAAERHDIDPLLLHAIAHVESRHNAAAVSPAGARGLMQVMPATAKRFGLMDPARELMAAPANVEVSAAYLKTLQERFGNNLPLVLAAYNAGEGAVERHGRRVPDYPETRDYVAQVLRAYRALREAVAANRSAP
ncbi:lytic transglycosylase domain-containing protein [Roseateles sp.]|uniref:lytic transglycosylase domain-containing protein n=1 Tax=Roseateles sp. TaxID=1971397 RepID=UPI0031D8592F